MAKVPDYGEDTIPLRHRKRRVRWGWRLLKILGVFVLLLIGLRFALARMYHGPQDLPGVIATMPRVPIFPYAKMAPNNRQVQRAMAIPLLFMRYQGASRAEAAQLQAPADDFFIADWYRRIAPSQGWTFDGQQAMGANTRLIFTRGHEGLQVLIGATKDIYTPFQLIYLQGMSDEQLVQLTGAIPGEEETEATPPTPAVQPVKPHVVPTPTAHPVPQTPGAAPFNPQEKERMLPRHRYPVSDETPSSPRPRVNRQPPKATVPAPATPPPDTHRPPAVSVPKPTVTPPDYSKPNFPKSAPKIQPPPPDPELPSPATR